MRKLLFITLVALASCKPSAPDLHLRTTTVDGTVKKDSLWVEKEEYFEISLVYQRPSKNYLAKHIIEPSKSDSTAGRHQFVTIVTENDSTEYFEGAASFLDYMNTRGYMPEKQQVHGDATDYKFRRNKGIGRL